MPDGLAEAMSPGQRQDLIRFLMELGLADGTAADRLMASTHQPASFPLDRAPLHPENWPSWQKSVNRDRLYDFYTKEAEHFRTRPGQALLPEFPGLDGAQYGHWGNQTEATWVDNRWNNSELGSLMCGLFHGSGVTVPKGVCVRLGDH